jgi:hypothetical protein
MADEGASPQAPGLAPASGGPVDARTAPEDAESLSEAQLVRQVRWRLVAWSGGSTLLVLLALGIALYVSVASSLQSNGLAALDQRVD